MTRRIASPQSPASSPNTSDLQWISVPKPPAASSKLTEIYLRLGLASPTLAGDQLGTRRLQEQLAALSTELESTEDDAERRMSGLAQRLSLCAEEQDYLWTLVALDADPRVQAQVRHLLGTDGDLGVSPAGYCFLFDVSATAARALAGVASDQHPLVHLGIVVPRQPGPVGAATPMRTSRVFLSWLLTGTSGLAHSNRVLEEGNSRSLNDNQRRALTWCRNALADSMTQGVFLRGTKQDRRIDALEALFEECGRSMFLVPAATGERQSSPAGLYGDLLLGAFLENGVLVYDGGAAKPLPHNTGTSAQVYPVPTVILGNKDTQPPQEGHVVIDWPPDTETQRVELWKSILACYQVALPDHDYVRLAREYRVEFDLARRVSDQLRHDPDHLEDLGGAIRRAVMTCLAPQFGNLAHVITCGEPQAAVVLPPELREQARFMAARIQSRHRVTSELGFGAIARGNAGLAYLFSGPPGTGKTALAHELASALGYQLVGVDLAMVTSKWVGETEKNLAALFDAAEAAPVILLFDEADALFAKRSENKSGQDRYANLTINYLLQRIERFSGVAILTTNAAPAIDPAMARRFAGHLVFPAPEQNELRALWDELLRPGAGILADDVDTRELARRFPKLAGGTIRNAILAAAACAVCESRSIRQADLIAQAHAIYLGMGNVSHL